MKHSLPASSESSKFIISSIFIWLTLLWLQATYIVIIGGNSYLFWTALGLLVLTALSFRPSSLKNRIALAPMCQYVAKNGFLNDWHYVHYSQIARSGIGLVIVEATAVSPEGRITPNCLGIWNDEQKEKHIKLVNYLS